MSLIEVLVTVAILLVLMTTLSLGVFHVWSEARPFVPPAKIGGLVGEEPPDPPALRSVDLSLTVAAEPVADGATVHSQLELGVAQRFTWSDVDPERPIVLPLPEDAREVSVSVLDADGRPLPGAAAFSGGQVAIRVPSPVATVDVAYRTTALDRLTWALPAHRDGPVDLRASLSAPPDLAIEVPADGLAPTARSAGSLRWDLDQVLTSAPIRVEVPADRTSLGRVARVSWLAALGLLAFCGGFWYASEGERPGHLDDFHLGGLLLLALNYTSFYAIYAVLGARIGLWAAPIALAVSAPLLTVHVARLTSADFAVRRVLPLALLTVGAVLSVVYLDAWRPLVIAGLAVATVAVVTLTWRSWSSRRAAWVAVVAGQRVRATRMYALEQAADALAEAADVRGSQVDAARRLLADLPGSGPERAEAHRAVDRLERSVERARGLVAIPGDWELLGEAAHAQRCGGLRAELSRMDSALERQGQALAVALEAFEVGAARAQEELSAALGALERALAELALAEAEVHGGAGELAEGVAGVRAEAGALARRVARPDDDRAAAVVARQLARSAEALIARLREAARRARAGAETHCAICGEAHAAGSRFCSGCGAIRPLEIACASCGAVHPLPRHLLRDGWEQLPLHCASCGAAHARAA